MATQNLNAGLKPTYPKKKTRANIAGLGSGHPTSGTGGPRKLDPAALRRREIRQQIAKANGWVKDGETFDLRKASAAQVAALRKGSGLGQGLGLPRSSRPVPPKLGARRKPRRGGVNPSVGAQLRG